MSTDRPHPEVALLRYLRMRGYTIVDGEAPGEYVVTHIHGDPMPFVPRLSLPRNTLVEYLDELERTPKALPGLTSLSLTEANLDEALEAGETGPNHTIAVGVRATERDGPEFFWDRANSPESYSDVDPTDGLEWRAERPGQPGSDKER